MACGAALAMFVLSFAQIMAYGFPLTTWITLRKHTDLAGMKGTILRFTDLIAHICLLSTVQA